MKRMGIMVVAMAAFAVSTLAAKDAFREVDYFTDSGYGAPSS
jgi:hypothetical protein